MKILALVTGLLIMPGSSDLEDKVCVANLISPSIYYATNNVVDKSVSSVSETVINKPETKEYPSTTNKSQPKETSGGKFNSVIYKAGTPIRVCWHGIKRAGHTCSEATIKIGKKAEPYMPFMSLCGAIGNIATPFTAHFISK